MRHYKLEEGNELENQKSIARHTNQNEGLIFEKSSPGKRAFELPPLDVPAADPARALGANHRRAGIDGFPEVSEIEVLRHFTRLSTWNYAIDLGMYPLGSCTMKYNPRVNEFVARLDGIATEHPYQPQELSQGCLKILRLLEKCLLEITGMDAITLQPAAGAHGEMTGLLLIRTFSLDLGLFPVSGYGSGFFGHVRALTLPMRMPSSAPRPAWRHRHSGRPSPRRPGRRPTARGAC